jgi:acetyltransferase-like isoleucine patch superfamily enzyme
MLKKMILYFLLLLANPLKKSIYYSKFLGIKFGKNVRILHFPRFGSEPYLIEIGDNVTITRGVCFVTHDGGVSVFRDQFPNMNVFGKIKIGNNVFIGINSIILPSVTVGNNVVIGAGSIVNKDIPNNVVVAGIPAKVIKTLSEYKQNVLDKSIIVESTDANTRRKYILEKLT